MIPVKLVRWFWRCFAAVAIVVALAVTAARALFPYAEQYRSEVEREVSRLLEHPVHIKALRARWRGLSPEVVLTDVSLYDAAGGRILLRLNELQIALSLWESALHQRLSFGKITAVLDQLALIRAADGRVFLQGYDSKDSRVSARELAEWMLQQDHLGVRSRHVSLRDEATGRLHQFVEVSADLRNSDRRHWLEGAISLPAPDGQSLSLNADIEGNPLDQQAWSGTLTASGKNVSPHYWMAAVGWSPGIALEQGNLDFKLTSDWRAAALHAVSGRISARGLRLRRSERSAVYAVDQFTTALSVQKLVSGWRVGLRELTLSRPGHNWPTTKLSADYLGTDEQGVPRIIASGSYLSVNDIIPALQTLLPANHTLQAPITGLNPGGELSDWHLRNDSGQWTGQFRFNNLGVQAWQQWPGLKNVAGAVNIAPNGGSLTVSSPRALFEWPRMFRWPIAVSTLQGTLQWQRQADAWVLSGQQLQLGNEDIQTATNLELRFPLAAGKSPHLRIYSGFQRGDGNQVARYLPVGIMSPDVVEWLDDGLQGGTVPTGTLVVDGSAADFPYAHGNGTFEVAFDARGVKLLPSAGWPLIEDIDAHVRFFGQSMEIQARSGRIFRHQLSNTRVAIADMAADTPVLSIDGEAWGSSAEKLRYLSESPLRDRYADIVESLAPIGDSRLNLSLAIGLAPGSQDHIAGKVSLQNNRLRVLPARLDFTAINGELAFSDEGLQAQGISGTLYRQPVTVDIKRQDGRKSAATVIEAFGRLDAEGLQRHFQHPLFNHFNGTSSWQGRLILPDQTGKNGDPVSLTINSPLTGMSVDLLAPFNKTSKETRKLMVRSEFGETRPSLLYLNYGDLLGGVFRFHNGDIERGQLLFGQGTPQLPELPGLSIAGHFSQLSVSEWLALLKQADQAAGTDQKNGRGILPTLRTIDLAVDHFEVFQQPFDGLHLTATRMAEQWLMHVDSQQLQGKITLHEDWLKGPVQMDLEYWRMAPVVTSKETRKGDDQGFDMAKLPSLQVNCRNFSYGAMTLGRLDLQGQRRDNSYRIERVELTPPASRITLQGDWTRTAKGEQTRLEATVTTRDAAKTMAALGYADTIREGKGQFQGTMQWPGTPFVPDMAHSGGKLNFRLDKGRLLDVDPGAGRILGILSLQALPRRLTLDFTDMFNKGLTFDYIEGSFDIANGIATTDDMRMESPTARIDILGKVDLARQRYDQRVVVTPYATENLPLIGALTAATPQIGAAIVLAQQLFKKVLRKLTQYEYTITGPWDAPKVERRGSRTEKAKAGDAPAS